MSRLSLASALVLLGLAAANSYAQKPVELAISAGAAMPMGGTREVFGLGPSAGVGAVFHFGAAPIAVGIDANYARLGRETGVGELTVTGVGLSAFFMTSSKGLAPYVRGGIGAYRSQETLDAPDSRVASAANGAAEAGLGCRLPVRQFELLIEAKYVRIFTTRASGEAVAFLPVNLRAVF